MSFSFIQDRKERPWWSIWNNMDLSASRFALLLNTLNMVLPKQLLSAFLISLAWDSFLFHCLVKLRKSTSASETLLNFLYQYRIHISGGALNGNATSWSNRVDTSSDFAIIIQPLAILCTVYGAELGTSVWSELVYFLGPWAQGWARLLTHPPGCPVHRPPEQLLQRMGCPSAGFPLPPTLAWVGQSSMALHAPFQTLTLTSHVENFKRDKITFSSCPKKPSRLCHWHRVSVSVNMPRWSWLSLGHSCLNSAGSTSVPLPASGDL